MSEKEKLGILVPTNKNIEHVIGVARAAKRRENRSAFF